MTPIPAITQSILQSPAQQRIAELTREQRVARSERLRRGTVPDDEQDTLPVDSAEEISPTQDALHGHRNQSHTPPARRPGGDDPEPGSLDVRA